MSCLASSEVDLVSNLSVNIQVYFIRSLQISGQQIRILDCNLVSNVCFSYFSTCEITGNFNKLLIEYTSLKSIDQKRFLTLFFQLRKR